MKKLTFLLFAGMLLAFNSSFGQSFAQLYNGSNSWNITSTRYFFYIDAAGGSFDYSIHVKNTSTGSKDIFCRRIYENRLSGSVDFYCWGGQCLDSTVAISPYPTTIAAGETNSVEFHATYYPNGNMGACDIQYRFYSNDVATDTVSAFISIISTPAGINDGFSQSKLVLGPVPADDFVNVVLPQTNNQPTIQLHALDGRLVKSFPSATYQGSVNLDLSDIHAGTYTLSLYDGGVLKASNRLIIR